MPPMAPEAWLTLTVVLAMLIALVRNLASPDLVLAGGLTIIMLASIGTDKLPGPEDAVAGFGNPGLITIAVLFVVVTGLAQTGAMQMVTAPILGRPKGLRDALTRLTVPTALLSGFLNNTPVVAAFMPVVTDWCRKTGINPSKLFMPLSFATILGGTCTLIGTSTNLIIHGLLIADGVDHGLHMFSLAWVGVPALFLGLLYLIFLGPKLLPARKPALSVGDDARQYTAEVMVEPNGVLVGQTIEKAGLRHLPGLFLVEIERAGEVLPAVGPATILHGNDRLVFAGVVESVVDLRKMRGLLPAEGQVVKLQEPSRQRVLVEAVVSNQCPLVGKSVREGRLRTIYKAAIIAVARSGARVQGKIGDIVLRPGDTLLIEASPSFVDRQRNSRDFFLVSAVAGSTPPTHERAKLALLILAGMIALSTSGLVGILPAAMLAGGLMILTRCCTTSMARANIDWQVLIVIGAALGIGAAIDRSGLAAVMADLTIAAVAGSALLTLAAIYVLTNVFTAFITNNAAAVLMYPVAHAAAYRLDPADPNVLPYAIAIAIAASCDFSTPIGYQTNLMVYGPGGYRFADYLKVGLPLNAMVCGLAGLSIPLGWPL